jgi:hypothetical protein
VGHGGDVAKVVERHDLDIVAAGPDGPPEVPPNPTEAVDTYANRHDASLLLNESPDPSGVVALACALSWHAAAGTVGLVSSATLPTNAL